MSEFATAEENISTIADLDNLERTLTNLIESYELLKLEKEQIEQDYYHLKKDHEKLNNKQHKIEHRVKNLIDKLESIEI